MIQVVMKNRNNNEMVGKNPIILNEFFNFIVIILISILLIKFY